MWHGTLLAVLVVLGGAGSAQAQAQTQPQTKRELVAKLVQLQQTGIENIGLQIAVQTSQRFLQAAGQVIPRLAADKREAAAKDVQAEVKKFYDDVEPLLRKRAVDIAATMLVPLYEERFSEDELKQVIAWLESPVSKKLQQLDAELGGKLAQRVMADTGSAVEPRLKTLEANLSKRLGVSPVPASGAASGLKK